MGTAVEVVPDADGGACVLIKGVDIGEAFSPSETWVAFQITWTYPDADCYPHFIDPAIKYVGTDAAPNPHPLAVSWITGRGR